MVDDDIPAEEERLLARVRASLAAHAPAPAARGSKSAEDARRAGYADEMVALRDEIGEARLEGSGQGWRRMRPRRRRAAANRRRMRAAPRHADEMVALRDEIGEARLEDVPQLVAQMERLQGVSLTRADLQTMLVDPASPYFGHLRLREEVRGRGAVERDVLVGRATFVDAAARINIVDWRHAPVSQLFYRYAEGSDYEERFGDRDVEGEIVARRIVTIEGGALTRVACPQGVWVRAGRNGNAAAWQRTDLPTYELAGGQGTATRPAPAGAAVVAAPARGVLGAAPAGRQALDRHLPEIAALIDPRQFDVITARDGVVVIQGGAGSGKTTVGLHRLAYLAHTFPEKFGPRRLAVVTHGAALAAYIGAVLPSLGTPGVRVVTFRHLAERGLAAEIPWLRARITDDAVPPAVTRVKSHPALLHELERLAAAYRGRGGKRGSRAAVELWADLLDRSRPPAGAAARRRRDAGLRARRRRRRTVTWSIAWRRSSRAIRATATRPPPRRRSARARTRNARPPPPTPARSCTGPRWASSTSPASAPSTAISPRASAASRATATWWPTATTTPTTIRTCAAPPASTACAPRTTSRCWTWTTWRSCCAPASWCAA